MSTSLTKMYIDTSSREIQVLSIGVLIALLLLPQFLTSYQTRLATAFLILLLFVVSYDLLIGYAGVLSFGHALPYGIGAYFLGLSLQGRLPFLAEGQLSFLAAVVIALIAVLLVMLVTGALALRTNGIYFAMVTLAFAQIGYIMMVELDSVTDGENGLFISFPDVFGYSLANVGNVYYLSLVCVVISYLLIRHLVKTPFGLVLRSIRQNEERAQFIGLDAYRFQLAAYTISGLFAGIAGMLFAISNTFITPDMLYWETSGDAIMMAIIGGIGTLWGPALGVAVTFVLEEVLSGMFLTAWPVFIGIFFVLVVMFIPGGLAGIIQNWRRTISIDDLKRRIER
ncbi:branched-chain amino acid ABC transporter permease [Halosolutus amylolyticus]|uniref:Branched-chain amino acid ABC transporter permease n=1 Tax=Halosolutus amylolyticus TaxID=2932267 RepID=A0ABD5PIY8_9EURY|nr:branched-chain amino acid ABC transporter permease [Halosolutus amylolyticus]